ncbi:TRAM domain-containing protein [Candidatus Poribacteria bacterium]|nr:TRAM domain-containing protein [Candidatus Poribacteria bacterium]
MNEVNNIPKVNDEIDVTIESVGKQGDGVAKHNGFIIFVPDTKKGENVRIVITKVFPNYGFAEVIQTLE